MTLSWTTLGLDTAKTRLEQWTDAGQPPSPVMLFGPHGLGKTTLLREWLSLGYGWSSVDFTADWQSFDCATGNVDDLRDVLATTSSAPLRQSFRVVLLEHIDAARPALANLLLKTLEEPSRRTVYFLTASTRRVLPTIWSRCQVVICSPLNAGELEKFAKNMQISPNSDMITLASGCPGRLLEFSQNETDFTKLVAAARQLLALVSAPVWQQASQIPKLAELEPSELRQIFSWLPLLLSSSDWAQPRLRQFLHTCQTAELQLSSTALNRKLLLAHVLWST